MSRLDELVNEFTHIERAMGDPEVLSNPHEYTRLTRRHRELAPLVELVNEKKRLEQEEINAKELLNTSDDPDMSELAKEELVATTTRLQQIAEELELLLLPTDPDDSKGVILELRAGAGGAEASLFVMDLLRMYERYGNQHSLKINVLEANESDLGGASKVVAEVSGEYAFRALKWERGVHRVQRVPATESQGRIHTSTATVAVLPEAEPDEIKLDLSEVRVDVFRAQGAGGQGVNTTDSAVRVTYRAGTADEIVVICQDGRSQIKNREKALQVLSTRLAERERMVREAAERQKRASQVGSGDRSEKIRTYNYPQNRVTDHRLDGEDKNHPLDSVIDGQLSSIVSALARKEREEQLLSMSQEEASHGAA